MNTVKTIYIHVVPNYCLISVFPFPDVCNNYLLTGRNISTTATSVYGLTDPKYIYDPSKALLNSQEEIDGQGHTKIGSWTANVNDKNQFLQVRQYVVLLIIITMFPGSLSGTYRKLHTPGIETRPLVRQITLCNNFMLLFWCFKICI